MWYLIQHIMEYSALQVSLYKVKAHTGDSSNDIADSLAKAGRDLPPITPSLIHTPKLSLIFTFNNIPIESSCRHFLKNLFAASSFSAFLDLNRNDHFKNLTSSNYFHWPLIWWFFTLNSSSLSTSFETSQLKSFIVKSFVNELPTLSRLEILRPDLYKNWCCVGCNIATETPTHMWSCSAYAIKFANIISLTQDLLLEDVRKHSKQKLYYDHLPDLLCSFDDLFTTPSSLTDGFLNVLRCQIPLEFITLIHKITRNKNNCYSIIVNSLIFFFKKVYNEIWKHRCKLLADYEVLKGIINLNKRKHDACKHLPHSPKQPSSLVWESWILQANKFGNTWSDF